MCSVLSVRFGLRPQHVISWACPTPTSANGKIATLIPIYRVFHNFMFFNTHSLEPDVFNPINTVEGKPDFLCKTLSRFVRSGFSLSALCVVLVALGRN